MPRISRFGFAAILLLLALAGAYTAFWWIAVGRIADGLAAWRSAPSGKIEASWQTIRVAGFPFAFRVEFTDAAFRDRAWTPAPEIRLGALSATARPWNFRRWRFEAPGGFDADLAATGERPAMTLAAKSAEGTVAVAGQGAFWVWIGGHGIRAEGAGQVPIQSADAWIVVPPKPASPEADPKFGLALALHRVGVPEAPANFGHTIDTVALGLTLKGALPPGPLPQALSRWRDEGGTVEVDDLHLDWSGVGISASGTLALDRKLQPVAAFSGGIEGFGTILDALVAADRMTPEQASLVQIALTSLARPGPTGKPRITAPFTIQNGKMYLGPARLGSLPRFTWE
jgi:hypothetical protein